MGVGIAPFHGQRPRILTPMNFPAQPLDVLLERSDACAKNAELGNTDRGHRTYQCAKEVPGRTRECGADTGPKNCYENPKNRVHGYSFNLGSTMPSQPERQPGIRLGVDAAVPVILWPC